MLSLHRTRYTRGSLRSPQPFCTTARNQGGLLWWWLRTTRLPGRPQLLFQAAVCICMHGKYLLNVGRLYPPYKLQAIVTSTSSTYVPSDALAFLPNRTGLRSSFPAGRALLSPLPLCRERGGSREKLRFSRCRNTPPAKPCARCSRHNQPWLPPRLYCMAASTCDLNPSLPELKELVESPRGSARSPHSLCGHASQPAAAEGLRHLTFPNLARNTVQKNPQTRSGERRQYLVRRRPPVLPGRVAFPGSAGKWRGRRRSTLPGCRAQGLLAAPLSRGCSLSARLRVPLLMKELFVLRQRLPPVLAPLPAEPGSSVLALPELCPSTSADNCFPWWFPQCAPEEAQGAPLSCTEYIVFFPLLQAINYILKVSEAALRLP